MDDYQRFLAGSDNIVSTVNIDWEKDEVKLHGSKRLDQETVAFRNSLRESAIGLIQSGKVDMGKGKRVVAESQGFPGRGFCAYLCRRITKVDDYFVVFGDIAEDKMIAAINAYGREVGMEEDLVNKGKVSAGGSDVADAR